MYKSIILLSFSVLSFIACNQPGEQGAHTGNGSRPGDGSKAVAFKLSKGHRDSSEATYALSGISVSFKNTPDSQQTISILKADKRLINYIRATDTTEKALPVPYLTVNGKDTLVSFSIRQKDFRFKIKDNKATYTKVIDSTRI